MRVASRPSRIHKRAIILSSLTHCTTRQIRVVHAVERSELPAKKAYLRPTHTYPRAFRLLLNNLTTQQLNNRAPGAPHCSLPIGACSRRINIQYRLIYQVLEDVKTVKIIRLWTHYE